MPPDQDPFRDMDISLDDEPRRTSKHSKPSARRTGLHVPSKKVLLIIAGCLLAVAVLIAVLYFMVWNDASERATSSSEVAAPTEVLPEPETPQALDPAEAAKKVTFKSDVLKLEFAHRKDWTVTESSDKASIVIASPNVSYQTVNGTVPGGRGVFTLVIRKGVSDAQASAINSSVAVRASELIGYDKPTDVQRHYTNVSYLGSEDAFTTLFISGGNEYKKGEAVAGSVAFTADYYLLAGGFGEDPDAALAFDEVAVSQVDNAVVGQAVDIVKSLRLF